MDFQHIPNDLPIPIDDGGSDHLPSLHIPSVILRSTDGSDIRLDDFSRNEKVVVYCYPMTGRPGIPLPDGWDALPGLASEYSALARSLPSTSRRRLTGFIYRSTY